MESWGWPGLDFYAPSFDAVKISGEIRAMGEINKGNLNWVEVGEVWVVFGREIRPDYTRKIIVGIIESEHSDRNRKECLDCVY